MDQLEYLLSLNEILSFVNDDVYVGQKMRVYDHAEKVLQSNHLLFVGKRVLNEKVAEIFALCLQFSDPNNSAPHELNLKKEFKGTVDVKGQKAVKVLFSCQCTCKAGASGKCKHSVALLLFLNRY